MPPKGSASFIIPSIKRRYKTTKKLFITLLVILTVFTAVTPEKVQAEERNSYTVASAGALVLTGIGVAAAIYVVSQYLITSFSQSSDEELNFTAIYNEAKKIVQEAPKAILNSIIGAYLAAKIDGLSNLTLTEETKQYLANETEERFDALFPSVTFKSASYQYTSDPTVFKNLMIASSDEWYRYDTDWLGFPYYNGATEDEQMEYSDSIGTMEEEYFKLGVAFEKSVPLQNIYLETAKSSKSIYLPAFDDYFDRIYIQRTDTAKNRIDMDGNIIDKPYFYLHVQFYNSSTYQSRRFFYRSDNPWILPTIGQYINNPSDTSINFGEVVAWLDTNLMNIEVVMPQTTTGEFGDLITERDAARSLAKAAGVANVRKIGSIAIGNGIPVSASYDGREITYSEEINAWTYADTGVAVPGLRDIYDDAVAEGKSDVDTERELGAAITWNLNPPLTGDVGVGDGAGTGEDTNTGNPGSDTTGFFDRILSFLSLILAALYDLPKNIIEAILNLPENIAKAFSSFWASANLIWSGIRDAVLNLPQNIANALSSLWEDAGLVWTGTLDAIQSLPGALADAVSGFWTDAGIIWTGITNKLSSLPKAIAGALTDLWNATINGIKSIAQILQDIWNWLLSLPLAVQEAIVNAITWAFGLDTTFIQTRLTSLEGVLHSRFINWKETKEYFTGYSNDMNKWPGLFADFKHYGIGNQMVVSNVAPNHYAGQMKKWIGAMLYFLTFLFIIRKMATLVGNTGGD